ncbi:MAG: hypothetical protein KFH87_04300 [Bacteroidetes bacterium]|nr:hypothetical protein [Bacteroidota bacterium]
MTHGSGITSDPFPLLRRRSVFHVLIIYTAVALLCAVTPMLHTLGYESAVVFGLLAAWTGALVPLSVLREWRGLPASPAPFGAYLRLTFAGWLLLVVPFGIMTANALFVRNCAMFDGALFWLLIPFVTVAFSNAVLLFFDALLGKRAGAVYYLLLLLLLVQPLLQIYTQPRIFAYNHVFGMFLGLSWDQSQPPFATLAMFRLMSMAYIILLLIVTSTLRAHRGRRLDRAMRRRNLLLFLPVLLLLFLGHLRGNHLGFDNSYAHLHKVLGSEYRLENVLLVYDAAVLDSVEVHAMAEEHLFQLREVAREVHVAWDALVISYIYPSRAVKKRLLGTSSSDLARPWRAEMHLTLDSWSATLRHELVHVVAARFGPAPFGVPFLRVLGLTEGLAMAIEWSWGNRTLHEFSAGMMAQGHLPHARTCMSTAGFLGGASSKGYVASGSLTRWLIDSLGIDVVRQAYAQDDLVGVTGMEYGELDRRWRTFLATVQRELPDSLAVAYAFRRPSIFRALCPRVLTERNREAAGALRRGDAAEALALYEAAERLAPNARSAFGILASLYEQRRWDSVATVAARYLADTTRAFSLLPMRLWQGAARSMLGDTAAARQALAQLCEETPPGWPTDYARRMLNVLSLPESDDLPVTSSAARDAAPANAQHAAESERGKRIPMATLRDTLIVILADMLLHNPHRGDSLRKVSMQWLLQQAPENPVIIEEFLHAHADDREGRRQGLRAWRDIATDRVHPELRLLAARMYYRERDWDAALRTLQHFIDEEKGLHDPDTAAARKDVLSGALKQHGRCTSMTAAALRNEIREWIARCKWQIERSVNVRI